MTSLFLALAVVQGQCPNPLGWSSLSKKDREMADGIHKGCKKHYGPDSCAVRIEKTGPNDFRVLCKSFPSGESK